MVTVDVDGPSAVGKTTLIRLLTEQGFGAAVPELLDQTDPPFPKPQTAAQYLERQIWFLRQSARRYGNALDASAQGFRFIDFGVIEVVLHTKFFPIVNGLNWDVFSLFVERIQEMVSQEPGLLRIADGIIYLYAQPDTLRARCMGDPGTSRRNHEKNLLLLPDQQRFYHRLGTAYPGYVHAIDAEAPLSAVYAQARHTVDALRQRDGSVPNLLDVIALVGS